MTSHPCLAGAPCSCHRAGPSTLRRTTTSPHSATSTTNRTAPALLLAALVAPAFAAPAPAPPSDLPFLYPSLARRVTDAGQAPDDPTTFSPEHIQVEDLVRAGLPLKFIFDPSANLVPDSSPGAPTVDVEVPGKSGAWIVDDYWELHGKRFGPLSATATADITDDPLPTPTESVGTGAVASETATPSITASPSATVLTIESSLPTGWGDKYDRSGMYPIPIVISFSIVIALMIGSLIGALVFRRGRRRSRRKKKELAAQQSGDMSDGEESLPEKVVRRGLAARVGRVIRVRNASSSGPIRHHSRTADDSPRSDVEQGEEERERARERSERNDLERRVKSWARRSAVWRVQARLGMRRRIAKGNKRGPADDNDDNSDNEATQTQIHADPTPGPVSRAPTRPASPAASRTSTEHDRPAPVEEAAPLAPTYASPIVPNYSEGSHSQPQPGPSTSSGGGAGGTEGVRGDHDAHPDATPDNEPAYDYGVGLPPAYMRGEGRAEVRRGKMPIRSSVASSIEPAQENRAGVEEREGERREWSTLDAYAFGEGEGRGVEYVTAHVATDDKRDLERLRGMTGAPREEEGVEGAVAPREEDVFGLPREVEGEPSGSSPRSALPSPSLLPSTFPPSSTPSGALPAPPAKTGTGPVARYGEADLSLPRYLDGESAPEVGEGLGVGLGLGGVPSAPPEEDVVGVSTPPMDDEEMEASAPPGELLEPSAPPAELLEPSAPPLEEADIREDTSSHPLTAPRLHHVNSSAPLLHDSEDR